MEQTIKAALLLTYLDKVFKEAKNEVTAAIGARQVSDEYSRGYINGLNRLSHEMKRLVREEKAKDPQSWEMPRIVTLPEATGGFSFGCDLHPDAPWPGCQTCDLARMNNAKL